MENEENQEFNSMPAVEELQKSIKDNEMTKIVELLCKRSHHQRQKIKEIYYSTWGRIRQRIRIQIITESKRFNKRPNDEPRRY